MMETFLYGALGALLPELHRWMSLRADLKPGSELPRTGIVLWSALITVAWVVAAGAFATALPGQVVDLTAVYAGISLPATVALAIRRPLSINLDTIELDATLHGKSLFRHVLLASWA